MSVRLVKPRTWFWKLLGSFIAAGALGMTTGPSAALLAPDQLNVKTKEGIQNLLLYEVLVFLQGGLLGAMIYLAKYPLPELVENGDTQHHFKPSN